MSGFRGVTYPDDLQLQKDLFDPLVRPIVEQILGGSASYELFPRRGVLRGPTLPPCDVGFPTQSQAVRFRTEGVRLSRAKQDGMAHLFFNPCVTLATRYVLSF